MERAVILTEAGKNIGYGHIMRCVALQDYFISNGIETKIFLNHFGDNHMNELENIDLLDWLNKINDVENLARAYDNAIVDSYLAQSSYYKFLKLFFDVVIAIDDYNRIVYPVDLVLNPNIYGDSLDYSRQHARIVGGNKYVIIRNAIRKSRENFKIRDRIETVLIMLGGCDYRRLAPILIQNFYDKGFNIIFIAGSDNYRSEVSKQFSDLSGITFIGFANGIEIIELITKADVVITAAGQTLNELAFMGVPSIAICIDKDQFFNIKTYCEKGFLLSELYWDDTELCGNAMKLLEKMKDARLRRILSKRGKELVDGSGVANILKIIKEMENYEKNTCSCCTS